MCAQRLEDGDLFERAQAEWIRKHLGKYEDTWSKYIGNDGTSHAFGIPDLTGEQKTAYSLFCQSHYSLALFTYLLDQHTDQAIQEMRKSVDEGTHRSVDAYFRDTQNFTLFIAFLGQVCDMVETIAAALNRNEIAKLVVSFAKERNNAIHAARIPVAWDYAGVKIAKIAGLDPKDGKWKEGVPWESLKPDDFHYLEDWMNSTRRELITLLNYTISEMIWGASKDNFGLTGVVPPVVLRPSSSGGGSSRYFGSGSSPGSVSGSNQPPASGGFHGR